MLISLDKMTGTEVREVLVNIDRVLYVEPRTRRIFFTCEDAIVVTKESMQHLLNNLDIRGRL